MNVGRFNRRIRNLEDHGSAVIRIRRELDFFPEPGRKRLGYSKNDCHALVFAVLRDDKPMRMCSEDSGTEQNWSWLEQRSGTPVRTIGRILRDFVYLGGMPGNSLLSQAAEHARVRIRTEARSQILIVTRIDHEHRLAPRRVDAIADDEPGYHPEEKSAHTSYGEGQVPSAGEIEEEVIDI